MSRGGGVVDPSKCREALIGDEAQWVLYREVGDGFREEIRVGGHHFGVGEGEESTGGWDRGGEPEMDGIGCERGIWA